MRLPFADDSPVVTDSDARVPKQRCAGSGPLVQCDVKRICSDRCSSPAMCYARCVLRRHRCEVPPPLPEYRHSLARKRALYVTAAASANRSWEYPHNSWFECHDFNADHRALTAEGLCGRCTRRLQNIPRIHSGHRHGIARSLGDYADLTTRSLARAYD